MGAVGCIADPVQGLERLRDLNGADVLAGSMERTPATLEPFWPRTAADGGHFGHCSANCSAPLTLADRPKAVDSMDDRYVKHERDPENICGRLVLECRMRPV
jgi:hypothetical protein